MLSLVITSRKWRTRMAGAYVDISCMDWRALFGVMLCWWSMFELSTKDTFHLSWLQGIIINGCIRDSEDIGKMPLGVKALNTYPLKSSKRDQGLRDVTLNFAGCIFNPGDFVYADKDGILVSPFALYTNE